MAILLVKRTIEHEQVLRTGLNNSEIRYTKIYVDYFPDRGCVHTLHTLYVYATGIFAIHSVHLAETTRQKDGVSQNVTIC